MEMNISKEQYDEVMSRFSYHLPDAEGVKDMEEIQRTRKSNIEKCA